MKLEIYKSATKHGIAHEDIEHAVSHAMSIDDRDDGTRLYLGPARDADLLEMSTIPRSATVEIGFMPCGCARDTDGFSLRPEMKKKTYGKTRSGVPITEELIEKLAAEAEAGYDVDEILRKRRGRPPIGSGPAKVESVRLDPELREALVERARSDAEAPSSVIRKALRKYLAPG